MFTLRRVPYITTAILIVSLIVFVMTHDQLQRETNRYLEIESQTVSALAIHPQLSETDAQKALVDAFRTGHPQDWERMASAESPSATQDELAAKVRDLAQDLDQFQNDSLIARFAIFPPHRSKMSYLTANFLCRDWTQLIFNLIILGLVGGTLEDVWGGAVYAGMVVVCALFGSVAYSLAYTQGLAPLVGPSGMVAALMGFYIIRFPKVTIERGTAIWAVRSRLLQFSSPVYVVFPLWVLGLMLWGRASGETSYIAYLAQGGAFAGGAVIATVLWVSGIEDHVSQKVEARVAFSVDQHIADASEYMQKGDLDAAIAAVITQIAEKPNSVEAHEMLVSLYSRKGNATIKYLKSLESLCDVYLKAAYPEAAWERYEIYLKAGGQRMPAETWLQLARFAENQANWQRALTEYEELARAWPDEHSSILALISAGRIQLQLGRREEAKQLYTAAKNSHIPHPEWDDIIRKGLEKSGGAVAPKTETTNPGVRPTKTA